jgi:hypothetical protein
MLSRIERISLLREKPVVSKVVDVKVGRTDKRSVLPEDWL